MWSAAAHWCGTVCLPRCLKPHMRIHGQRIELLHGQRAWSVGRHRAGLRQEIACCALTWHNSLASAFSSGRRKASMAKSVYAVDLKSTSSDCGFESRWRHFWKPPEMAVFLYSPTVLASCDSLRFNLFHGGLWKNVGKCVGKMWHIVPETFRRYTVGHYKPYDTD